MSRGARALSDSSFEKFAVGQSVSRTEDPRLLRGDGCFTDDFSLPGQAYGYVFRSPYAHGVITTLDVSAAKTARGVLAVLTAADLEAEGVAPLPCRLAVKSRDGSPLVKPERPSLATDRVRYCGEAVAFVVAESLALARDAAELIQFDVDVLPAVTDAREAMRTDAPQLHDAAKGNQALDWEFGDGAEVDRIFESAHHVSSLTLRNNRVVVAAMEPRAAVGEYDADSGRYTMHVPTQGVFGFTGVLATQILCIPREQLRVRTYEVGGSFGMKSAPYPEYAPVLIAARLLGRPVKWCDYRSDSFMSDQHGRDSWAEASLAFDAGGRILAGRVVSYANLGGYLSAVGPSMSTRNIPRNFPGVYRLPVFNARSHAVFTNTTPIGAYRGAGRPEGVYYMERLMDTAAREMGIDRIELRRRNIIAADEMPYDAVSELTYDSGDFPAVLDKALAAADWDGFDARRETSAAKGMLRGLGIGCYLEVTGPPATEMGGIRFEEDGTVTMVSGSLNYGQGHAATFAQILTTKLGIPFDRFRLLQGDSDELIAGAGTGGSRTVISAGTLLLHAADAVIENGRQISSYVLEAAVEDIEFERGTFRVAGTDRAISIMELADSLRGGTALPDDVPESLDAELAEETPPSAFPNGCHIAEVEIAPDTGVVRVDRYVIVDDFGTLINPMLVEGQVHGGVIQGLGQALMETTSYSEDGQLISGSYMDYVMPRADDLPDFVFASHPVPAKTNPLGAKGCGEAGCTGALPAIMNAIVDVLAREAGITHFDMPATSQRLWSALKDRAA
ncbi:MAG: molybdopterin-dependent oxidoreductase [Alphaproteobacteria bacterium]|nr:molybdopterin-dependent oxidoreductase [Alphaproteobacteria bacterium]